MVDVSQKDITERKATACASVAMDKATLELIMEGRVKKGDVLLIPPYWSYIQEVEKGIIQYHIDIDTYFTFIPNFLKEIYP